MSDLASQSPSSFTNSCEIYTTLISTNIKMLAVFLDGLPPWSTGMKRQAWPIQRELFCKHQCLKNINFQSPPHSTPCTSVTIREQGKVGNTRWKCSGDLWMWTTSRVKRNLTFLWLGSYGKFIPNLNYLILEWIEEWKSFIRKRLPSQ